MKGEIKMSKNQLIALLVLGATGLGLTGCGQDSEPQVVAQVQEETTENEEAVDTVETLPETEEQEAHDEGQPYTVVEETDNGAIYQYHGSVFDFIKQMQNEVIQAEQGSEDLPLMQLIIETAMASALQPDKEYTLITKGGDVLFTYKGGEPVAGILLELE
jgi:hypothetical protein